MHEAPFLLTLAAFFAVDTTSEMPLQLFNGLTAGFPSPAADFIDLTIDLNKELIKNPSTTFLARIEGESMIDIGIGNGDIVLVDRSLDATDGRIVVAFLNGAFTIKRIQIEKKGCWLVPENSKYPSIWVTEESDFQVWGVVINVIKSF